MIQVIVPTIVGRERTAERCIAAYKAQGAEVLLVKGAKTAGEGWAAGLRQAEADIVMLGCDDFEPHEGALEAGIAATMDGIFPSPRICKANGTLESCGTLGGGMHFGECATGTLSNMSSVPMATGEMWELIGEPLPIHYYVDDHLGWRARSVGLRCEVVRDFAFTHLENTVGTQRVIARAMDDRNRMLEAIVGAEVPNPDCELAASGL